MQRIEAVLWKAGILPAALGIGTYGFESLRNFIVGWRLNVTEQNGTTRNFLSFTDLRDFEPSYSQPFLGKDTGRRCALRAGTRGILRG